MNLTPVRIGCAVTVILGAIFASAGLMDSLTEFGIGLVVASAGVIGYGLCDFIESNRNEKLYQERRDVWQRRDTDGPPTPTNIYTLPRDGRPGSGNGAA